ncbi:protein kinase [Hassallia byssoidea VB512170]|uniref:Protein kinase n=1 Tax=Hassallia byssoidea VB512170 TaxID=1304833 RepID=A0A846HBX9_9CYAN|nr:serine/threonine-protein kinase [Hassalia byssoidea]NEU74418.1 protein kinase [Hassalia byssoidea VB512170]
MSNWAPGHQLKDSRYIIRKILGKGGFGIAYWVLDTKLSRDVVIKTLNPELKAQAYFEKLQQDFYHEARCLSRCSHPHIVQIYDFFSESGLECIVMQYIPGDNLNDRAFRGITQQEALNYIHQISAALQVVHKNNLVHRDVKPANIIIQPSNNEAVLIDFGIAREVDIKIKTRALTECFAPIEQYSVDAPQEAYTDIYALAATLYFLLTKQKPVDSQTRYFHINQSGKDPLISPQQLNPRISPYTNNAILQGMKIFAAERPQSIIEWLNLLDKAQKKEVSPINLTSVLQTTLPQTTIRENTTLFNNRDNQQQFNSTSTNRQITNLPWIIAGIATLALAVIFIVPDKPTNYCQKRGILTICRRIADVPNVPALTQVLYGGSTLFSLLNKLEIARLQKYHPQFKLEHTDKFPSGENPGSSTGIKWLIEGKISFAQTALMMTEEPKLSAKNKGFTLREEPIAYDAEAVCVNSGLTSQMLKSLTLEDLRNIFQGKVTNWQQLGGPDLKITPFRLNRQQKQSYVLVKFQETVLKKQAYGTNVQEFANPTELIKALAETPGSITTLTVSQTINKKEMRVLPIAKDKNSLAVSPCADDKCTAVNKNLIHENYYPQELNGKLYVVIKLDSGFDEQAGIAYANIILSDEGQKMVEEAGFVPFRRVTR